MSKLLTALSFFTALSCKAQTGDFNSEFKTYNNGLVYSEVTMVQLTHIVDSLNLKFKRCDLKKPYYAVSQAIGNYVSMENGDIKKALADLNNNISFDDFIKKYKDIDVDYKMLVLRRRYNDSYSKKWGIEFSGQTLIDYGEPKIRKDDSPEFYGEPLQGKWIINYNSKSEYSKERLNAFYIIDEFKSVRIPVRYARMILYSDCVIDTTTDIFTDKAQNSGGRYYSPDKDYKKTRLYAFNNYIEQNTRQITEKDVPAVYKESKWYAVDSMRNAWIDQNLVSTEKFKQLLADALKEAKEKNTATSDKFEAYVARYISKADALEMKRNRRVIGGCSMDQSPRYHALNIAMLSAETVNWQVFLRAHLNIMNDRFDRASDGSWAWAGRNTYIKELEELNIEVQELLLGISFRIENPVEKHYYGNISRLGRALAETKNRIRLEDQLLSVIKDNELDSYNRMLIHYLYLNYIYYLPEKEARFASLAKLEEADKALPDYIRSRIKIKKENFDRNN